MKPCHAKVITRGTGTALTHAICHRCKCRILAGEDFEGREPTRSQRINSPTAVYYFHAPRCPRGIR